MSASEFRRLLEDGDVKGLMSLWAKDCPHLPQPQSLHDAEIMMHRARTEAASVSFKKRAYSHHWLLERNFPSGLPDRLQPNAKDFKPVSVVGISINSSSPLLQPAFKMIQKEMSNAVEDVYANGDELDIELVKRRMQEAKTRESIKLFGRFKSDK